MDTVKEDSYQILKWRNWDVKAQDRWMEVENQEGQGSLWAVVPLMTMMMMNWLPSLRFSLFFSSPLINVRRVP
jgi:hypothetical protein